MARPLAPAQCFSHASNRNRAAAAKSPSTARGAQPAVVHSRAPRAICRPRCGHDAVRGDLGLVRRCSCEISCLGRHEDINRTRFVRFGTAQLRLLSLFSSGGGGGRGGRWNHARHLHAHRSQIVASSSGRCVWPVCESVFLSVVPVSLALSLGALDWEVSCVRTVKSNSIVFRDAVGRQVRQNV